MNNKIIVHHNFDCTKFKWLYAKYSYGVNPNHHCTNAIKGRYSKLFSRNNPEFKPNVDVVLDEYQQLGWDAIYICGVSAKGYSKHENYPHNVHIAIIPAVGKADSWQFENWKMTIKNAQFEYVIEQNELDDRFKCLPEQYVSCRMFRWAVSHYKTQIDKMNKEDFDKNLYGLSGIK